MESFAMTEAGRERVVTRIVELPRRPGRYAIFVDGLERGVVSARTIGALGLAEERAISDRDLEVLDDACEALRVFDRAADLLAVRARSVLELRRRLMRTEAKSTHIDQALAQLVEIGALNDEAYAKAVARGKRESSGFSRRRLEKELFKRGVPRQVASEAIADTLADSAVDEFAAALDAARKRMRSLADVDATTRRRRLYGFLARRGYEPELVNRVLRAVLSDEGADAD
jgi:regulatory protein